MRLRLFVFILSNLIALASCAQSASAIDSMNQIILLGKKDIDEVKTLNVLAEAFNRQDVGKSRMYLYAAINLAGEIQYERGLSNAYSQMVTLFHNLGAMDSTNFYLNKLKNLALGVKGPDADVVKANYYSTAGLYFKKSGNLKEAVPFYKQAVAIGEKLGIKTTVAGQLLNLGNVYINLGDYQQALTNHLKALRLFEEINNQKGIAFCYQSISNSFIELKQFEKALKYARLSSDLKTATNDKRGLGTTQNSLGMIYHGLNKYDDALAYFNTALGIAREFKSLPDEVKIFFNLGKTYAAKKQITKAAEHFNQAKILAGQINDSSTIAAVMVHTMALEGEQKLVKPDEKELEGSIALIENTGNMNKQVTGYKNMAAIYTSNQDFEKALQYTNKYHELNDSMQNTELKLRLAKMDELYTVEKKEKEIAILKKDQQLNQQELKQKNFFLVGSLVLIAMALGGIWLLVNRYRLRQKMKELQLRNQIAADLHDEVGSSLSSIHLLSRIAVQQNTTANQDILNRVSNNAHETMEKMSDIVWMIKAGENDGNGLVERMQRFLYELCAHMNIEYILDADALQNVKLNMAQRKNIYLIFKEAVNNSIKYSGTNKIDVVIKAVGGEMQMQIKDFGKGFDQNIIIKGNGLDNMQARAKDLKGKLAMQSSPESGTELNLKFQV